MFQTQVAWPYQSSAVQRFIIPGGPAGVVIPKLDIYETQSQVVYILEVPGIDNDRLEVEIEGRNIRVSAPILNINPQEASYRYQERQKGQLFRIMEIVPDVDPDSVTANVRNGLLELRFKKLEDNRRGRKINVNILQ
ncbi:MAG: Molecular chaperone (Small heat shock protein)-like protein [Clostridia bacterium 41_269]|nr:MAG: Molecular chaperone (Small heat shock protein)-like protein [Clostridia bacterium 41_269]